MKIKSDSTYFLDKIDEHQFTNSEVNRSVSSLVETAINSEIKKAALKTTESESIASDDDIINSINPLDIDKFDLGKVPQYYNYFKDTHSYSRRTQRWQGHVLNFNENNSHFTAKVEDLSAPGGTYEILEFDIDDVSPDDQPLVQIGAIFYWSVGSLMSNGQLSKQSILRFKRVAVWTQTEFDDAADLFFRFENNLPKD